MTKPWGFERGLFNEFIVAFGGVSSSILEVTLKTHPKSWFIRVLEFFGLKTIASKLHERSCEAKARKMADSLKKIILSDIGENTTAATRDLTSSVGSTPSNESTRADVDADFDPEIPPLMPADEGTTSGDRPLTRSLVTTTRDAAESKHRLDPSEWPPLGAYPKKK